MAHPRGQLRRRVARRAQRRHAGLLRGEHLDRRGEELRLGFFIDEPADDSQREALETIFAGNAGGWPAGFAELMEEVLGFESAPIDFEIADDLAWWRVEIPGKVRGRAEALTGPTTPEGQRVQVHNAPGAEVGPGQVATWAWRRLTALTPFGFTFDWAGRSSKHFPFEWSGPGD